MSDMGAVPPCGMVLGELLSLAGSKPSLNTLLRKRRRWAKVMWSSIMVSFSLLLLT